LRSVAARVRCEVPAPFTNAHFIQLSCDSYSAEAMVVAVEASRKWPHAKPQASAGPPGADPRGW
jgi:hypothetical protein